MKTIRIIPTYRSKIHGDELEYHFVTDLPFYILGYRLFCKSGPERLAVSYVTYTIRKVVDVPYHAESLNHLLDMGDDELFQKSLDSQYDLYLARACVRSMQEHFDNNTTNFEEIRLLY